MGIWRSVAAWPAIFVLLSALGCGTGNPFDSDDDVGPAIPADTSTVRFVRLTSTAYDADGVVETGLTLQWQIEFSSTTGRACKIQRYKLYSDAGQTLFEQKNPRPDMIRSGEMLSAKERWIPIEASTSAGTYKFRVFYELGRVTIGVNRVTHWSGPYTNGQIDTIFTVN